MSSAAVCGWLHRDDGRLVCGALGWGTAGHFDILPSWLGAIGHPGVMRWWRRRRLGGTAR